MDGALLIDKPAGPTSHDIVAFVRRVLRTPRVGHTGTLDPLATGLLVLLVGHATRCAQFLVTDEKEYLADVRLGQATATYDAEGLKRNDREARSEAQGPRTEDRDPSTPDSRPAIVDPQVSDIEAVLGEFRGTFLQMPPPYSAKKVDGVRAYKKARTDQPVELLPVEVTVRELEWLSGDHEPTLLRLRLVCTSGFYVRSLAHDIGQRLGCGAHLEALRRTRAGRFSVADAHSLPALEAGGTDGEARLIPMNTLLADMPAVTPTDEGIRRVSHGNTLAPGHLDSSAIAFDPDVKVRVLDRSGDLLAVAQSRLDGLLHPLLVLR
jgi:tRNA pseudouridine55 synthase